MNTVKIKKTNTDIKTTLRAVLGSGNTAFVGQCGYGPEHSLYLINYSGIILADVPLHMTWASDNCQVTVERYVNITITED